MFTSSSAAAYEHRLLISVYSVGWYIFKWRKAFAVFPSLSAQISCISYNGQCCAVNPALKIQTLSKSQILCDLSKL